MGLERQDPQAKRIEEGLLGGIGVHPAFYPYLGPGAAARIISSPNPLDTLKSYCLQFDNETKEAIQEELLQRREEIAEEELDIEAAYKVLFPEGVPEPELVPIAIGRTVLS